MSLLRRPLLAAATFACVETHTTTQVRDVGMKQDGTVVSTTCDSTDDRIENCETTTAKRPPSDAERRRTCEETIAKATVMCSGAAWLHFEAYARLCATEQADAITASFACFIEPALACPNLQATDSCLTRSYRASSVEAEALTKAFCARCSAATECTTGNTSGSFAFAHLSPATATTLQRCIDSMSTCEGATLCRDALFPSLRGFAHKR